MKIIIDIPDEDIPKRQDMITVDFVFIDGHISQCDYPFEELPKGHGNLIDAELLLNEISDLSTEPMADLRLRLRNAPTVIEAESEE